MNGTTLTGRRRGTVNASHGPMDSQPTATTNVILAAAKTIS